MAESGENEPSQQLNRLQATVKELGERLSYVEEERGMLVGQKEVLTSELEKALKERSESDLQVFQLSENLRELQYTRSFLDELVREKELLEGRVVLLTKELSEERARGRQQAEATGLLREETEHLHEAVRSSDSERKSAVLAFEEQGEVFHEKIQTFATRIRDLQSKLAKAIHEREASSSNANSIRRSFEQLKTDNGGMVSLMGTMEKKLNEYSQKESRMDELAASCKESAEQALLERDQAVANEAYLRQELSRLREVRVKEYDERERQHLGALTQAKEQAERECNVKDKAVAMLRHDNEHLRVACDRAQRDCESSEVRLQQVSATVETERRVVKDACRGLEQRVRGAEDACAKAESELERLRQERRTAQVSGERSEREAGRRERMNEERRSKAEAELAAMEEKVEALVDEKARAERDKASLASERDALVATVKRCETLQRENPVLRAEVEDLRQKTLAMEVRLADAQGRAQEANQSAKQQLEFALDDKQRQEGLLSEQLRSEREQVNAMADKQHELCVDNSELKTEVAEMHAGYADAIHRAELLEAAVVESQQRITELSIQLADSGGKEQQHIREQSRLKGEIARLRFSVPSSSSPSGRSPEHPIFP